MFRLIVNQYRNERDYRNYVPCNYEAVQPTSLVEALETFNECRNGAKITETNGTSYRIVLTRNDTIVEVYTTY